MRRRQSNQYRHLHQRVGAGVGIGLIAVVACFIAIRNAIAATLDGTILSTHRIWFIAIGLALVAVLVAKPHQTIAAAPIQASAGTRVPALA